MSHPSIILGSPYRSLQLRCKEGLQISEQIYCGTKYWVVGDPIALEFYRFNEQEYSLLSWCDGTRSLDDIKELFEEKFAPYQIKHKEIQSFLQDLYKKSLLISISNDQGRHLYQIGKKKKIKKAGKAAINMLAIRWKGINPDRILEWAQPYTAWFFSKPAVVASILFMLSALALVLTQYQEFVSRLPSLDEFFGPHNFLGLVLVITATKIIHEFGHGLVCKKFGGICHELGIMFLVFVPTLFVNTSDSWRIRDKWQRAAIGAAGIYVELIIASIATYLWWFMHSSPFEYVLLNIMVVCTVSSILFNGNPLLRFDGYFILADILEIPNLGERSDTLIRNWFLTYGLGVRESDEQRTPWQTKTWLASYCILSYLYKAFIAYMIAFLVVQIFRPFGLEQLSIMFSIGVMIALCIAPLFGLGKYFWIPGRKERIKKNRLIVTLAFAAGLIAIFTLVPTPEYVKCQFEIKPEDSGTVYAKYDGLLQDLFVQPGQHVAKGTVIGRLRNIELEVKQAKLEGDIESLQAESRSLSMTRRFTPDEIAKKTRLDTQIISNQKKLDQLNEILDSMVLVAPADGYVMPYWQDQQIENEADKMMRWHGETLRKETHQMAFKRGQPICQIGDTNLLTAKLMIDQADIREIKTGQKVRMMLHANTEQIIVGNLETIAQKNVDSIAIKHLLDFGGNIEADSSGEDDDEDHIVHEKTMKTARPVFEGIVSLENVTTTVSAGQKGHARIFVGHRTMLSKFTKFIFRTFRFDV